MSNSPVDIQHHLYHSFLHESTPDVTLRVRGTWSAVYHLHRVVLIQSGFFRSLFTSGFSESRSLQSICLVFDDLNITRAAFEVCVSRLYGGGPPLYIPPSIIPITSHPLTPAYPASPFAQPLDIPEGHHLATPRFLLSLLATSVYLSIPFIASNALASILSSIGPWTVIPYLNFALGKPIGPLDTALGEKEAAVGLDSLAHNPDDDDAESTMTTRTREDPPADPTFHYGSISDKIGEATACWLARWGTDVFALEEAPTKPYSSTRKRATTLPSSSDLPLQAEPLLTGATTPPTIFAPGGLSASWIRALISSDSFFVFSEKERFDFAKRVVDLRRSRCSPASSEEEEKEWEQLFSTGIYYANMDMPDLLSISQDLSPVTGKPYVPLHILQSAHWDHATLRHQITYRPSSSSTVTVPLSPIPGDKELGIGKPFAEGVRGFKIASDSSLRIGENEGGGGEPSTISMEDLFSPSQSPTKNKSKAANEVITNEAAFFGLHPPIKNKEEHKYSPFPPLRFGVEFWDIDKLKEKQRLHSQTVWYAGSLFNVYVQIVRKKEKAGGGGGGRQVGIYLHRQSTVDIIPPVSAPAEREGSGTGTGGAKHARGPSLPEVDTTAISSSPPTSPTSNSRLGLTLTRTMTPTSRPSIAPPQSPTRPNTSSSLPSSVSTHSLFAHSPAPTFPNTVPGTSPPQPYRDPRGQVSAHFSIACASGKGNAQTRFSSSPDVFKVSQSWGWKSAGLIDDGEVEGGGRDVSLRATVVLGVV